MASQFPEKIYPKSHIMKIMAIDMLVFLIGLLILATPVILRFFPGAQDTSAHVGLGALIATIAIGRVLVAHGSIWMDIVLIVFGVITACMPRIQHMQWDPHYNTGHLAAGAAIILLSLIAMAITVPAIKNVKIV